MTGLTAKGCAERRAHLLKSAQADLIVITNPRHIFYLTGMYNTPLALSHWGLNFLLMDSHGKSTLVAHNFIEGEAKKAHVDEVQSWRWYDAATDPGLDPYAYALKELNVRLRRRTAARTGVEIGWLPFGAEIAHPVDVSGILAEMRRVKYPDEMHLIREAAHANDIGQQAARKAVQPGATELDVYNAIYTAIHHEVGHAVLPLGDYASGERAFGGGGAATTRVMRAGEMMIVDIFPVVNGYRADTTSTLSIDGHLSDLQHRLETALHAALAAGESMLKAGHRAGDVYQAVANTLYEGGFGEGFNHHAGHGLGLGHPEAPYFVPNSDETLVAGDVVTLEPGSYGDGFGARIEHNYLVTEHGYERLTHHRTTFDFR